jgi:hypothetical protein
MADRINRNIDWVTDDSGELVGYADKFGRRSLIPRITYDAAGNATGLVGAGGVNPLAALNAELGSQGGRVQSAVAVAGDSIQQDSMITVVNAGYTTRTYTQWGPLAWARRKLGLALQFSFDRMYAVPGHTLAQIRDIQLPQLVAGSASRVIMDGGINSITNGVSYADCVSTLTTIFEACESAGIFVDYLAVRACASGNITDAQARAADRLNRWIAAYAATRPEKFKFHDWNAQYLDLSTGYAKSTYLRDGKHDNSVSAYAGGVWLAGRLGSAVLPTLGGAGDVYHATDNPLGNTVANWRMTGTAGSKSNGVTGNVADTFSCYRTNAASTATVVASIEADDTFTGINRQVMTFGGTADSVIAQLQQTQNIPGNISVGDRVRVRVLMDVNIPAGYQDLGVYLASRDGSYVKYGGESWDGTFIAINGALPAINETNLVYETEPFVVGAGSTVLDFFVRVQVPTSGSLTGVVKVKALDIRKLP